MQFDQFLCRNLIVSITLLCEVRSMSNDQGWEHVPIIQGFQALLAQNLNGDQP